MIHRVLNSYADAVLLVLAVSSRICLPGHNDHTYALMWLFLGCVKGMRNGMS